MKRYHFALAILIVAVVAAAVYLPTLRAEFVYDDVAQLVVDDYVHHHEHFWEVLTFRVMGVDVLDYNRPVMLLTLIIDSMLHGREPLGYHLTNILLHAACSAMLLVVIYQILTRLSQRQDSPTYPLLGAFAGALLFAVHPLNSEAVSPVTFREDLLVAFFALLVFVLIDRFPAGRRWQSLLLGAACAVLVLAAVASKETGATVPVFLALYWLVVRRRRQRRAWAALVAAACIAVGVFVAARFTYVPQDSAVFYPTHRLGRTFAGTLEIQPRIWTFQLLELFRPDLMCADLTVPHSIEPIGFGVAVAALAVVVLGIGLLSPRNPAVGLGAALYWLAILPASNLLPMYRPIADRYMYFPMTGAAMVAGAIIWRMRLPRDRRVRIALAAGGAVVLAVLAGFTIQRTAVWRDRRSLWTDTIARNPQSFTAHDNLGFVHFDAGQYSQAIACFKRSNAVAPWSADPLAGLAVAYDAIGEHDRAVAAWRAAVLRDPAYEDPARLLKTLRWRRAQLVKLKRVIERAKQQPEDATTKPGSSGQPSS